MKKLFDDWEPDMDFVMEDTRKISLALIIAGLLGLFIREVAFPDAISALFVGLVLWAVAIQKR